MTILGLGSIIVGLVVLATAGSTASAADAPPANGWSTFTPR